MIDVEEEEKGHDYVVCLERPADEENGSFASVLKPTYYWGCREYLV